MTTTHTTDMTDESIRYRKRTMPWSAVMALGRDGVEAFVLDVDHDRVRAGEDPDAVVFVPAPIMAESRGLHVLQEMRDDWDLR